MPYKYRRIPIVYKSKTEVGRRFMLNLNYREPRQDEMILLAEVICGRELAIITVPHCVNCQYCRGIGIRVVNCGWWEGRW